MIDEKKFAERLSQLRRQKNVSARDMSLSLGQSESYINKIENCKAMPSITGLYYICDYFGITPRDFFDFEVEDPAMTKELMKEIRRLDHYETEHVLNIVKDICKRK